MIQSLFIKNFALIDELHVDFSEGLNILTGQTGAGKSIIIGALNMILGERADTDLIRHGEKKAIAEAMIHVGSNHPYLKTLLEENGVDYADELILRREIRSKGSRGFINDTPVTISLLKEAGDQLVDLHGQHEHQQLLNEEHHRRVVDGFGHHELLLKAYRSALKQMRQTRRSLKELMEKEASLKEKLQLYQFQVKELEEADLSADEEEELKSELNLLDHTEELEEKAAAIVELGETGEANVLDMIRKMGEYLRQISDIEPEFETYISELQTARISIQEMLRFTEAYRNNIEFDPHRLDTLRRRQSELNRIQKKYGRDIPDLLQYLAAIRAEVAMAENFDLEIEKLQKQLDEDAGAVAEAAKALHSRRMASGEELSQKIVDELQHLGMEHTEFEVRVSWSPSEKSPVMIDDQPVQCHEHGADEVSFYISTNVGEAPKPLAKIASGGEISRIMLALKSAIAQEQNLPVMIFDEIDTGISGNISEKVGRTMRQLSRHCQIIAITHQPQIASKADQHFKVRKQEAQGRTISRIIPLDNSEHIREVASLMSGEEITDTALESARELIERSR